MHRKLRSSKDSSTQQHVSPYKLHFNLPLLFFFPLFALSSWYPLIATAKMAEDGNNETDLGEIHLGITFFNEADPNVIMSATTGGMEVKVEPPNLLKVCIA